MSIATLAPLHEEDLQKNSAEYLVHFRSLPRVDTSNPPGNERGAAEYLARVLDRDGIASRQIERRARPNRDMPAYGDL